MAPLAKVQRDGDAWSLELKIHTLTFARPLGCPSYPNQAQAASRDRWGALATLAGVPLGSNMARCKTTVHECGVRADLERSLSRWKFFDGRRCCLKQSCRVHSLGELATANVSTIQNKGSINCHAQGDST